MASKSYLPSCFTNAARSSQLLRVLSENLQASETHWDDRGPRQGVHHSLLAEGLLGGINVIAIRLQLGLTH